MSASEVMLSCDTCGHAITNVDRALLAWDGTSRGGVTELRLMHGDCDDGALSSSIELRGLADPQAALDWLRHLRADFAWTTEQLQRLTRLAWLVPNVAAPDVRRAARKWAALRTEAGL